MPDTGKCEERSDECDACRSQAPAHSSGQQTHGFGRTHKRCVRTRRLREPLRTQVDAPPGPWRAAAAAAGVSGADAFLCHLSRSISAALEKLAASAELARGQLRLASEAARSEDKPQCDELEGRIASFESSKRTALESELCAVDVVLERLRAERGAVAEAAVSLSDVDLLARHVELATRLDAAEKLFLALPTAVIEPPHVALVLAEMPADVPAGAVIGQVIAPRSITADDLVLERAPDLAQPGGVLRMRLILKGDSHSSQSADELQLSLATASEATHIETTLVLAAVSAALEPQSLLAAASADVPGRCVVISIAVPLTAPVGSSLCFGPLAVAGRPVAVLGTLTVKPPGPPDISPKHAAKLQTWLPPGGSSSPVAWEEVYRATTHGFTGTAFHERCDGRARLLVLVRARDGGWLFGGFTAVGFHPPERWYADPAAFLFSLTNSLGRPEKLASKGTGRDVYYHPTAALAAFGCFPNDLYICDQADSRGRTSFTLPGVAFEDSASMGTHPMARGRQQGWQTAEVVAWVV